MNKPLTNIHRLSRRGLLAGTVGAAAAAAVVSRASASTSISTRAVPVAAPASGETGSDLMWTTLGTNSGPLTGRNRKQPANLLHDANQAILIDCGDGAADQVARAGVSPEIVKTVILSHLHIDHTAGLYGVIGRRLQAMVPGQLTVYGPVGTKQMVNRIQGSLSYLSELMAQEPGLAQVPPSTVAVIEITEGSRFAIGPVQVRAATNSHYGFPAGSSQADRFQSLSLRFDLPNRSIVYTGDTGPSSNVERLARDADLLISEITDPEQVLAEAKARQNLTPEVEAYLREHFEREHLPADQVGLLAQRSRIKSIVLTHNPLTEANMVKAETIIGSYFAGPVTFANDLDRF